MSKIQIIEKENPPRIKEEFSVLRITVTPTNPNVKIAPAARRPAELKIPKPLVEKVEGPFNEKDEFVEEMEVGKTYIFKATKFKKSTFTPIKHIWWAEEIDDSGKITDLEYRKGENPYLDDKGVVCFKYEAKECEKVRIYAYVANPIKKVSIISTLLEDDYVKAIRDEKIVYTCNCGWIDKTHAFTDTKRTEYFIGVKNLWDQIINETGLKSNSPNENGFQVVYRQDATILQDIPVINKPFRLGTTKSYFVKSNLSLKQKEEVALAIFQEVSIEFEEFQSFGAVIGKGDSSFEPADLISNLINFYRIVKPKLTKEVILRKCNELTPNQSVEIYKKHPGTFTDEKYKNRQFKPKYFTNDNCNSSSSFPKELTSISPAKKNDLFRDWLSLFDIHGGKPPITGNKL